MGMIAADPEDCKDSRGKCTAVPGEYAAVTSAAQLAGFPAPEREGKVLCELSVETHATKSCSKLQRPTLLMCFKYNDSA